jgi:hypothetical protein
MTIMRIQVKETQRYWGDFEGTIESIIAALQAELDDGWVGLEYDNEPYCEDGCHYLYKFREENDKEYEKRMKLLEKQKKEKEVAKERRRKQYEKLKKEFGDD